MTCVSYNFLLQKEEKKDGDEDKKPVDEGEVDAAKAERVVQRRGRWGARTETRTHFNSRRNKRSVDDTLM